MAAKMTPERQKLADALVANTKASQKLAAIAAVASGSWELTAEARRKVEAAEAALAGNPEHVVADMVRRQMGEDVLDRPDPAPLEADLATALAKQRSARDTRAEIERQHQEAERAAEQAASAVRNAVADILQSAPEAAALAEEARQLEARLIECYGALEVIGAPLAWHVKNDAQLIARAYGHPLHPDWHLLKSKNGNALAAEWKAARDLLQTDAATPLPSQAKRPLFG